METVKAKLFQSYLKTATDSFYGILNSKSIKESNVNGEIVEFTDQDFIKYYDVFISELKSNCIEYQKTAIIFDYVRFSFEDILKWVGFEIDINKQIILIGYEIKFLLNLKDNIEIYISKIKEMCTLDKYGEINEEFENLIDSFSMNHEIKSSSFFNNQPIWTENRVLEINFGKFDLDSVKFESEELESTADKINFVQDRLYEYIQMKNTSNKDSITKELLSYSKDFEKLCLIELERLNKKLELELRIGSIIVPDKALSKVEDPEVNTYKWNVSDTDFLELVAALHYEGTIKRKDGKELTRKELIELFSHLFDMQIKDVEGKLTRATARMDKTPFLNSLKLSFENFAEGKEEKLRKRN